MTPVDRAAGAPTAALAKQGRPRMVAQGGATGAPSLPDLPTIAEAGYPGCDVSSWWGVLAPAGVPKEIITRLNHEVAKLMNTPEARDRMSRLGADIVAGTPEQLAEVIRSGTAKWSKPVRVLNIRMKRPGAAPARAGRPGGAP